MSAQMVHISGSAAAADLGLHPKALRPIAQNLRDAEKCLSSTQRKGGGRHTPLYIAPATSAAQPDAGGAFLITASLGQPRSQQGRAQPLLPPRDPSAAVIAGALTRAGLGAPTAAAVRRSVKSLPTGAQAAFPEQAALLADPWAGQPRPKRHPLSPARAPDEAARALVAARKMLERCDEKTATAFAAVSLPGRYAVMLRILSEIQFRLPDFKPEALMDYAAGSGSCMWAAMQVQSPLPPPPPFPVLPLHLQSGSREVTSYFWHDVSSLERSHDHVCSKL